MVRVSEGLPFERRPETGGRKETEVKSVIVLIVSTSVISLLDQKPLRVQLVPTGCRK